MGQSVWDDVSSSPSSDYSGLQGDSTWGPGDEKDEIAISSAKLAHSLGSGEEVGSKKSVVDHEEESGPSKGNAKGKYKCSVCGVMHLKPSLLKQHMSSHFEDVSLLQFFLIWQSFTSNRC